MNVAINSQKISVPRKSMLRRLGNLLLSPHPSITDAVEQRKAQVTILSCLAITFTSSLSLFFVGKIGSSATFFIELGLVLVCLMGYVVSRTPRFMWGGIIVIASLPLSGFVNVLGGADSATNAIFMTIPFSIIVGSAILPVWGNVVLAIGTLVGTMAMPFMYAPYTFQAAGTNAAFLLTSGFLLVVVQINRNNIEQARLAEVKAINQELREMGTTLEQRVAARTRDLAIVAEVGTAIATLQETSRLLQEVVDLTKERFNLYHAHIYLLDESGENLVLAAGAGEAGRKMAAEKRSIPLKSEQSLVARAGRDRKGVTVNDVTRSLDFLPNPLLPDTRSELAAPMIASGRLIGVFDIQSDVVGRFTESDVSIQTTLAAQVAVSLQNARSYERAKTQAEQEALVNAIGQKIQRAATVEDTLQIAIRELGFATGAERVKASIQAGTPAKQESMDTIGVKYA